MTNDTYDYIHTHQKNARTHVLNVYLNKCIHVPYLFHSFQDKKDDMVKFFAAMKDPSSNPDQEKKMREVLYGGRGEKKRHYAVDENLYGTLEGVEKRKMAEEEQEQKQKLKNIDKKKKKRKKKVKEVEGGAKGVVLPVLVAEGDAFSAGAKSAAAVSAVGALALVALLLGGGKRS